MDAPAARPSPIPPMEPVPSHGRLFTAQRRVRWGDADHRGRLRLDAVARYLQDISNDDTRDAGLDPTAPWVVRRTAVEVVVPARVGEELTLTTFGSGFGPRWAERRTSIVGSRGARIEASSVWVHLGRDGRPAPLDADFLATYAATAGDRRVAVRHRNPVPPPDPDRRSWPLRSTDLDGMGHVNNAATWEPVEDELARLGLVPGAAVVEYGDAIDPGDRVELASVVDGGAVAVWLLVDGAVRASAVVVPAPD